MTLDISRKTGTLEVPVLLMEDHRDAYFFWKELGLSGGCCVHVDAHLDVSDRRVPGYAGFHPEINCGNYLLPAMKEGLVSELIWVVPPHLKGPRSLLDWAQSELQAWMHLTISEYQSLRVKDGTVEGVLLGKRLVICESDRIPQTDKPVFLDIDADYYLDPEDKVWQTPLDLQADLSSLKPAVLTVAYSVLGGFTPLHRRYLGDLTVTAFQDRVLAQSYQDILLQTDPSPSEEYPNWLRAAHQLQAGWEFDSPEYKAAVSLDSQYQVDLTDLAWWRLSRKDYTQAKRWIMELPEGMEREYLSGFLAFEEGDDDSALRHWARTLAGPGLDRQSERHLLELQSRAFLRKGSWAESIDFTQRAILLERRDADLWTLLAQAQAKAQQFENSARSFRKSVSCSQDNLDGLTAQLDLADVYLELGDKELALTVCRRICKRDAPRLLKVKAEMMALKIRMALA